MDNHYFTEAFSTLPHKRRTINLLWLLFAASALPRGCALLARSGGSPQIMPSSPSGVASSSTSNRGGGNLFSYAPRPSQLFDTSCGTLEEFLSEFDDWVSFDDGFSPALAADDDNAAQHMLRRQETCRCERAERRARATVRLVRRQVRNSPDALRLVSGAASDFATLLGWGLFNAVAPLALDPQAADSFRVAVFGALNNATTGALRQSKQKKEQAKQENREEEQAAPSVTIDQGDARQHLASFIVRNALVPAALHRIVITVVDRLVKDTVLTEEAVLSSAADMCDSGSVCSTLVGDAQVVERAFLAEGTDLLAHFYDPEAIAAEGGEVLAQAYHLLAALPHF